MKALFLIPKRHHQFQRCAHAIRYEYKIDLKDAIVYECKGRQYLKPDDFTYSQDEYCKRYCSDNPPNKLKAIVFRDSYANYSYRVFPQYIGEVLYIWDSWKYRVNEDIIENEKPDIVIYSVYEGYLERMLLEPSFVEPEDLDMEIQ